MIKNHLLTLSALLLMLCTYSCKKDSDNGTNNYKIRYEITTNAPFVERPPDLGVLDNYIKYDSFSMNLNERVVTITNLSGTKWTKEITVSNLLPQIDIVSCSGLFYIQSQNGTANAKIYVNDVLRTDAKETVVLQPIEGRNLTQVSVGAIWIIQ